MKLLLLSNSTIKGEPYLEWPKPYLQEYISGLSNIVFIPYAGVTMSYDDYTSAVQSALGSEVKVTGIHSVEDKAKLLQSAQCIAVGGGNTFYLLAKMQEYGLLNIIREKVREGVPYIGWSAGSNVACPTIMTTNDMPIIQPHSFSALGLTDFQINAHFTEKTIDGHGGESRQQRLEEFLEVNRGMGVIGLPEGKLLHFEDGHWYLKGIESEPTYYFRYQKPAMVLKPGEIFL